MCKYKNKSLLLLFFFFIVSEWVFFCIMSQSSLQNQKLNLQNEGKNFHLNKLFWFVFTSITGPQYTDRNI